MVWLVLLIMIWIQTGWFWERDKKESRWTGSFHRKLYHGTCGKCPQIPERGLWQKELEEWQELGPSPQEDTPPVTRCSRFPNIMCSCILLALLPQLCCQVPMFPLPFPSFFRSLEAQGTCLPKSQDSATTQLTKHSGGSFGDHSSSMKWTRPPVLQHHSMSNGLYMLCHFIFKQLEWGVSSLYTGINWGSEGPTVRWGAGMWAQVSLIQSPQQWKQKLPESTTIFSVFPLHASELMPMEHLGICMIIQF